MWKQWSYGSIMGGQRAGRVPLIVTTLKTSSNWNMGHSQDQRRRIIVLPHGPALSLTQRVWDRDLTRTGLGPGPEIAISSFSNAHWEMFCFAGWYQLKTSRWCYSFHKTFYGWTFNWSSDISYIFITFLLRLYSPSQKVILGGWEICC